jgi:hypothetical protein
VELRAAKVSIHENHSLAIPREDDREIGGGRRLSFTGARAGDQQRAHRII